MRAEITSMVLYPEREFSAGGNARRWANSVERTFTAAAILEAPHGADSGRVNKTSGLPPGLLKAGIHGETNRVGPLGISISIHSAAPYTLAVVRGTGRIYARNAKGQFASAEGGLFLPANPGWGRSKWRQSVAGQRANNFFDRAATATAARHRALRGFHPG